MRKSPGALTGASRWLSRLGRATDVRTPIQPGVLNVRRSPIVPKRHKQPNGKRRLVLFDWHEPEIGGLVGRELRTLHSGHHIIMSSRNLQKASQTAIATIPAAAALGQSAPYCVQLGMSCCPFDKRIGYPHFGTNKGTAPGACEAIAGAVPKGF